MSVLLVAGAVALALLATRARDGASVISHGPRDRPWIALTFDADMTPSMLARLRSGAVRSWYDAAIVDELRRTRTPATIFLTGLWAATYPAVVDSLARDPLFELENHSLDHRAFATSCVGLPSVTGEHRKRREVERAASLIAEIGGVVPRYFSFPGDCHDPADVRLVTALGLQPVGQDVRSGDAFQTSAAAVVRNVLEQVRPGSIITMHLVGAPSAPATAGALRQLIPALRRRGFRFVTLHRLLARSDVVEPRFHGSVSEIDVATRAVITGTSWRRSCPVPIRDLRLLEVDHWTFDGLVHRGQLIVHREYADAVLGVFEKLFAQRFPIARMELIDRYGGDDDRSIAANNTSGFNCGRVSGRARWSEHAYGRAIHVNPLANPYVSGSGKVSPPRGPGYVDRARSRPGMIHAGDETVRAFASIGWGWGGDRRSPKDYQHFYATRQ